jgi:hypothetical protein
MKNAKIGSFLFTIESTLHFSAAHHVCHMHHTHTRHERERFFFLSRRRACENGTKRKDRNAVLSSNEHARERKREKNERAHCTARQPVECFARKFSQFFRSHQSGEKEKQKAHHPSSSTVPVSWKEKFLIFLCHPVSDKNSAR